MRSLGWEDSLEKGMAPHSSILKNSMNRGAWQATVHGVAKSWTQLSNFHFHLQQAVLYFFSSLTSGGTLICGSRLTMAIMLPTSWHPGSASRQHLGSPQVFSGPHSFTTPKQPPTPHLLPPPTPRWQRRDGRDKARLVRKKRHSLGHQNSCYKGRKVTDFLVQLMTHFLSRY